VLDEEGAWLEQYEQDRDAGRITFTGTPQPADADEPPVDDRDASTSVRTWSSGFESSRRRH